MKRSLHTLIVMAIALLLVGSAFASNRGSVMLSQETQVAGTRLSPGQYHATWEGNGPDVQLKLMRGGKVMATTSAHLVDLKNAPVGDEAIVSKSADGSNSLAEIRFSGKKYALQLSADAGHMSSGN